MKHCKYCKYATLNDEYLDSSISENIEGYLICKITDERVDDDFVCDKFKLDKRVYDESNC